MEWFIKFILVIATIYIVGYAFFRYLLPWLLRRFVRKIAQKMNVQFEEPAKKKKQGEINIDFVPENKASNDSTVVDGDYVDFEEIK